MLIVLLRHGETAYNEQHRYQGASDVPLFPNAKQIVCDDLREMDFGDFEGRTYDEMKGDAAYGAWLDSGCETACPNGESKAAFCERVCRAFERCVDHAAARGIEKLTIVAHGGTQMAALSRFVLPHRDYYEWNAPNAGGFVLDAAQWRARRVLRVVKTVCYAEEKA